MLDPADFPAFRTLAHRMLDDALDSFGSNESASMWRPIPDSVKETLASPVPQLPEPLERVYSEYRELIEPYPNGNRHPRFFGWVHGNGTPSGILAEMLAATLNANAGGREHSAVYVERAVIAWSAEIFGFPPSAGGLLTSGTSLANLVAVLVARVRYLNAAVRARGLEGRQLVAYASQAVHTSVSDAFDTAGLGSDALRRVAIDRNRRLDIGALAAALRRDRDEAREPFMVVASAGTVDVGAVDDLNGLADFCAREQLWLHVDGAFGALAVLSAEYGHLVDGIGRADSLAFDFHKWLHVPYDSGCILVRDGDLQRAAFANSAAYLQAAEKGAAAGAPWLSDYGPELSRRFRALAIWFAFKEHGTQRLGAAISRNCRQAARLAARVERCAGLELAAPVTLNIVCIRFDDGARTPEQLDALNAAIVVDVQQRGVAVPSTTVLDGRCVIRINLTNHRVTDADLDATLAAIAETGWRLASTFGTWN